VAKDRTQQVTVTVNGRRETFFLGLQVRHAIGWKAARAVRDRRAIVTDGDGNPVDLDGALYDGEILIVRPLSEA